MAELLVHTYLLIRMYLFLHINSALEAAKEVGGEGTVCFNSSDEGVVAKIVQHCATEGGVCT